MGSHDTQQVCLNGHKITDTYYDRTHSRAGHCPKCGAETIYKCPKCQKELVGATRQYSTDARGGRRIFSYHNSPVQEYCGSCGSPYPWTIRKEEQSINSEGNMTTQQPLDTIINLCSRFHVVAKQLLSRHSSRDTLKITDEYDVQDLLHALLRVHFEDIRPEDPTPNYAGKSSRVDFLLKNESIIIEVKKAREGLGAKEVGSQLIEDIARYKKRQDCKVLVCFVYDPEEIISNPQGIENDLRRKENGLIVEVIIAPRRY